MSVTSSEENTDNDKLNGELGLSSPLSQEPDAGTMNDITEFHLKDGTFTQSQDDDDGNDEDDDDDCSGLGSQPDEIPTSVSAPIERSTPRKPTIATRSFDQSQKATPGAATMMSDTVSVNSIANNSSQTRFSFYNAADFIPQSPKQKQNQQQHQQQNQNQQHRPHNQIHHSDQHQQQQHHEMEPPKRHVFNFYNAEEIKRTHTVITTVQAQAAAEEGNEDDNNHHHNNNHNNLDSVEILRSLQEHEQQRLEILGAAAASSSGNNNGKTASAAMARGSSVPTNSIQQTNAASSPPLAVKTGVVAAAAAGMQQSSRVLPSQTTTQSMQNTTTGGGGPTMSSSSNPYEDAIKEALLLLRKHRPGQTNQTSHAQPPKPETIPPLQYTPAIVTNNNTARAVQTQDYHHNNHHNAFRMNNDFQRLTIHTTPSATIPRSYSNDSTNSWENSGFTTPVHSDAALGEAYQAEIEARRKQRQQRMARYATRLAELKQETPGGASTSATPRPTTIESTRSWDSVEYLAQAQALQSRQHHQQQQQQISSSSYLMSTDSVLAGRSPESNMTDFLEQVPSHTESLSTLSNTQKEDEVQRGVERVLLAILERANSRGRSSSQEASTATTTDVSGNNRASTATDDHHHHHHHHPMNSSNLHNHFSSGSMGEEKKNEDWFRQQQHQLSQQQRRLEEDNNALLRALSELLGPTAATTTSNAYNPNTVILQDKYASASSDYVSEEQESHVGAASSSYGEQHSIPNNVAASSSSYDQHSSSVPPNVPSSSQESLLDTSGGEVETLLPESIQPKELLVQPSALNNVDAHLELDRMVEKIFGMEENDVTQIQVVHSDPGIYPDRHQRRKEKEEEANSSRDEEELKARKSMHSYGESAATTSHDEDDTIRDEDDDDDDDDEENVSYEDDEDDGDDEEEEASYIDTSDDGEYDHEHGGNASDKVLGPLSKQSGGTTGVVLEHDDQSSEEDEDDDEEEESTTEDSQEHSGGSSDSSEESESESDHHGAKSPTLMESLSAAVSLVTGVTSFEEKQPPPAPTGAKKDKYYFEDDDSDTDAEAYDLMRSLCAHLLPVGFDALSNVVTTRRILDPLPEWDEKNPDEPGYRIVRLSNFQLRRVQRAFDKMVDYLKQRSQRNLTQSANMVNPSASDETAFERDLQEAEELLDQEEKRLKNLAKQKQKLHVLDTTHSDDSSRSHPSSSSSSSVSSEHETKDYSESECLESFHGVKPVGKGEMGDLEFFTLPIIFKSHVTGFEPTKDLVLEPGNVIAGQYLVEGALGSAAFSTAYKCINLNADNGNDNDRHVCLKVIKNTKDFFDQSLDEIKILELLRQTGKCHENHIIEMKTFFYHREHLIIVTELLRQNLFEFGKFILDSGEEPYFTMSRLAFITRQCLIALNFTHKLGLVHSDIKPENILLASYSRALVKVIDYGSSCWLTDRQSSYIQSRSYRAPEVILGLPYDGRIDIWSLGCVVAEMFTGEVTFQNDSIVSMLSRIESICGPFPRHMIAQGRQSPRFFTRCGLLFEKVPSDKDDDSHNASFSDTSDEDDERSKLSQLDIFQPKKTTLAARLGFAPQLMDKFDNGQKLLLNREERKQAVFVDFVRMLLTIDPETRPTAEEALEHPLMQFAATLTEEDIKYPR